MDRVLVVRNPRLRWHSANVVCNGNCELCRARFRCYTSGDDFIDIGYREAKKVLGEDERKWLDVIFKK